MLSIEEINNLKALNTELGKIIECKNGTIATLANIRDRLKAENDRLKEEIGGMQILIDNYIALTEKYHQTLQDIKDVAEHEIKELTDSAINGGRYLEILDLITKAEEE